LGLETWTAGKCIFGYSKPFCLAAVNMLKVFVFWGFLQRPSLSFCFLGFSSAAVTKFLFFGVFFSFLGFSSAAAPMEHMH
jgi:hypothetical protein